MSHERRRHVRAPLSAEVTLFHSERCLGTFPALNLSGGGVLLAGEVPEVKTPLTAILELPGLRPLRAEATVARVRTDWDEATFALSFSRISASGQDALQDVVLRTLEQARAANVLVVAPHTGREVALARELKRFGRAAFHITRPAEAARFFDLQNDVGLVLIDEALPAHAVALLLGFMSEEHPEVVRVLVTTAERRLDAEPVLPAHAEELLHFPPSAPELRRILQLHRQRRQSLMPRSEQGVDRP